LAVERGEEDTKDGRIAWIKRVYLYVLYEDLIELSVGA
jgi:hypothetical protein